MTELPANWPTPAGTCAPKRELANVSRNTLARLARVSESYLTQVEKGQSSRLLRPGLRSLERKTPGSSGR